MEKHKLVMISSTARDLPEHRDKAMHACIRLSMFHPEMMEHLTATDSNAMQVSLAMVEKADIYVGVFAFRYGFVPRENNPQEISITEMEYNRAVDRDIPRLIFLMSDEHPVKPTDVETGDGAKKLEKLKEKLKNERVVGFFKSADDLLAQVIQALVPYRESNLTTFHFVSDIPQPPEVYIAHPYTLLQKRRLIGRQAELNLLTDWVSRPDSDVYQARVLNIIAIGGMGKSALTWKWFNDIAPQEMRPLSGRMWWSFYESDASFENFIIRALAYVTHKSHEQVRKVSPAEREEKLLSTLHHEPFLITFDGLERILIAYADINAAQLNENVIESRKKVRKVIDPRVARFLRKLTQAKQTRVLVSSRLYPADLESNMGEPIAGSFRHDISGLNDDDAIELWRTFGISGSRNELLPLFSMFDKHPLLIQALAGDIKSDRRAIGNFTLWQEMNPDFNPIKYPHMQDAMGHVLQFALSGLDPQLLGVLYTIAGFRMPARYDTLVALHCGEMKTFPKEQNLDVALTELEDRGLLGWDKRANRYDLHPIVRNVVWNALNEESKQGIYSALNTHFVSLNNAEVYVVKTIDDLIPSIELYNTLIGLKRYDDAFDLFRERFEVSSIENSEIALNRLRVELLDMLFEKNYDVPPKLSEVTNQIKAIRSLGWALRLTGHPGKSVLLHRLALKLSNEVDENIFDDLEGLSNALLFIGEIYEAERIACQEILIARSKSNTNAEGYGFGCLGETRIFRGLSDSGNIFLRKSQKMLFEEDPGLSAFPIVDQALSALWNEDLILAEKLANRALRIARDNMHLHSELYSLRVKANIALKRRDYPRAEKQLNHVLGLVRTNNLAEEEIPILIALAELRHQQGENRTARDFLDDVLDLVDRGPYQFFHADALNLLAQIALEEGDISVATKAATEAYRLAWANGEPYAYHWGLASARKHFKTLNVSEPQMPSFDQKKYEPLPNIDESYQ